MKNYFLSLVTLFFVSIGVTNLFAQTISGESELDKAVALSEKGDTAGTVAALTEGTNTLQSEADSSNGGLKAKLLGKVGDLKSLIPLASAGKLQSGVLGKAVNAVKMLVGANRISGLLGKGQSGLLGNASSLTSSLGLVKAGSSILGSGTQSQLGSVISEATKAVGGLDKKGPVAKAAAAASSSSLSSVVKLVSSAL